jgi:hypothetical protein
LLNEQPTLAFSPLLSFSRGTNRVDEAPRNSLLQSHFQLCVYNKEFSEAIGKALTEDQGAAVTTKDPEQQLAVLILEPLRGLTNARSRNILAKNRDLLLLRILHEQARRHARSS